MKYLNPGNYFMTKSMSWDIKSSKLNNKKLVIEDYWHTKKFLTFYYFLFSQSEALTTDETYLRIAAIFDDYINSLPSKLKKKAEDYFFLRDIKTFKNFIRWKHFVSNNINFTSSKQEYNYYLLAKKLYFVYLMNIGGQSGIKKYILKDLVENGVTFEGIGIEFYNNDPFPNKIDITDKSFENNINDDSTSNIINNGTNLVAEINDVTAPIRNFRRLYTIYGLFYESKLVNIEAFSLTKIGKSLLRSNFLETTLIMEHQKIKMISQPPTIEISQVNETQPFFIELNPYLKLLKYLDINKSVNHEEYQYKLSRNVSLNEDLTRLKGIITEFKRRRDKEPEDFTKELSKYLGGLTNPSVPEFNILEVDKKVYRVKNEEKLVEYLKILKYYRRKKDPKLKKYIGRYKEILLNNTLKNYYNLSVWYNYISDFDIYILTRLVLFAELYTEKLSISLIRSKYPLLYSLIKDHISNEKLEKLIALSFDKDVNLDQAISENFISEEKDIKETTINIVFKNELIKVSDENFNQRTSPRAHISYIKKYFISNKFSKCDCCGQYSFIKENGERYFEFHHLVPISEQGQDHINNLFGICANCHRKFHYARKSDREILYEKIDGNNNLGLTIEERFQHLMKLELGVMSLDFLLTEKAITQDEHENILTSVI